MSNFKAGDIVAVRHNRDPYIYGPRTLDECPPRYEGERPKVRIFTSKERNSWVTYDAESGRDSGSPGHTIVHWTPEVEAEVELYWLRDKVLGLVKQDLRWHRELSKEQCEELVALLEPIRERLKG